MENKFVQITIIDYGWHYGMAVWIQSVKIMFNWIVIDKPSQLMRYMHTNEYMHQPFKSCSTGSSMVEIDFDFFICRLARFFFNNRFSQQPTRCGKMSISLFLINLLGHGQSINFPRYMANKIMNFLSFLNHLTSYSLVLQHISIVT